MRAPPAERPSNTQQIASKSLKNVKIDRFWHPSSLTVSLATADLSKTRFFCSKTAARPWGQTQDGVQALCSRRPYRGKPAAVPQRAQHRISVFAKVPKPTIFDEIRQKTSIFGILGSFFFEATLHWNVEKWHFCPTGVKIVL